MSYATDALLAALHYDGTQNTLTISASIRSLGEVRNALRTTFGDEEHIQLTQVIKETPDSPKGKEALVLQGIGDVFGHESREVYMEFVLSGGEVSTLLMLIPLPAQSWQLSTGFPAITQSPTHPNIRLRNSTIVISHGLVGIDGTRTVKDIDNSSKDRTVNLSGYPLQDGLQILAGGIVNGNGALDKQIWEDVKDTIIPAEVLPDRATNPDRVKIRADVEAGWLQLDGWWDNAPPLEGTGTSEETTHAAGLAIHYDLNDPDKSFHYWLRELGPPGKSIVLEAFIIENFKTRYSTRSGSRIPLGEGMAALSTLIGVNSQIISDLALTLPDTLSLISFTYSPSEWISLSAGAGDQNSRDGHLISIGPEVDLKEVNFTFLVPLGNDQNATVDLDGKIEFFGVDFRVHVRPWELIEGGLDDPDGVHLGELLEEALSVQLPFGLDTLTLRQAWVKRFLTGTKDGEATTNLRIKLNGMVDLVPHAITLDAISLEINKPDDGDSSGSIGAVLMLGPVTLNVQATHEPPGNWTFDGTANTPESGISLTHLVDHLVQAFGASVPHEVPDVHLERITVNYSTATRALDIQAITNWEISDEVPVLGNSTSRVMMQLTLAPDPEQGGQTASFFIRWSLKKEKQNGNPAAGQAEFYELDAQAFLSSGNQSFGFDFNAPEGDPLELSDVVRDLGLPEIPKPAAGVLDTVFQVSSLSMNYARPGNSVEIAWTRPLVDGMLLAEYNQDSNAPAAGTSGTEAQRGANRQVEVSWLGNQDSSTLGIDNILALAGQPHLFEDVKNALTTVHLGGIADAVEEMLTFKQLGFTWEESGENSTLSFTALSTYRQGTHSFVAVRSGEQAGLVAGVSFVSEDNPGEATSSKKPDFLPAGVDTLLSAVEEILHEVELTHLLVSTVSSNAYQPPAFSSNDMLPGFARQSTASPVRSFGSGTMPLSEGLSIGARVKFGDNNILRRVIQVDELDGQLTIGEVFALQVSIPGTLSLNAGGGNSLVLTSPMLQIKESMTSPLAGPELDIMGGLDLHLFGQRLQMAGWLALSEESITGHIQLKAIPIPIPISPCAYLPGVQLVIDETHPLSLDIGLQFEPAGLDLGMSGSFAIYKGKDEKVYGDAVYVLEMIEEVPNPLYVEFSIDELSIPILLEAMTGIQYRLHLADEAAQLIEAGAESVEKDGPGATQGAAAEVAGAAQTVSGGIEAVESALGHVEAILSNVELTDVRMYRADSIVNLPDGTTAMPGVGVRGALKIFNWDAFAVMDFSATGLPGISGHLEAEPIKIDHVLRIWGDGQGVHKTPKTAEDFNENVRSRVAAQADGHNTSKLTPAQDEGDWFLEPGGPVLQAQHTQRALPPR